MTEQQYIDLKWLAGCAGWKYVQEHIGRRIQILQIDLENRNFQNTGEVALLQGQLRAYRDILDFPRIRLEGYERKQQNKEA